MMKKGIARGLGRRIIALMLSLIMIASVISVPVKAAENETEGETIIELINEAIILDGITEEDDYEAGSYITTHPFTVTNEIKAAATAGELLRLEVSVTVNEHEFTTGTPQVLVYAMDGSYGNWQSDAEMFAEEDDTYELSLDLSSYTSISELALRFKANDDGVAVNYTIHSARVVIGKSTVEMETIAELVIADTTVDGEVVENPGGTDYIVDYPFTIPAEVRNAADGIGRLRLDVRITVNSYTCSAEDVTTPFIMLYAQDGAYGGWTDAQVVITEPETTYTVSLDLSSYSTLGVLGLRIVGCDNESVVNYTINSATVVGELDEEGGGEDFSDVVEGDLIATLIDSVETNEEITVENEYGEDYIIDCPFAVPQVVVKAAHAGVPLKLNVNVTINSHELTTGTPEVVIYAMDGDGSNWKQTQQAIQQDQSTYQLSLDLSSYASIGTLGLRFATYDEGKIINYTINSAEVVAGEILVEDEDAIVTIIGSATEEEGIVIKNADGNDYILDRPFTVTEDIKTAIAGDVPVVLEVGVTVDEYTCTSLMVTPTVVLYAMEDTDIPSSWKQTSINLLETGKTYTIMLNLSDFSDFQLLGMRFVGCDLGSTIQYTINSAKIVEGAEVIVDPNAIATLADPGTTKSGRVIKNPYGEDMIVDNPFTVPHDLTFGLQGYTSLNLEVGVTVDAYTPDDFTGKPQTGDVPNGAKVVIYAQDSKYTIWEQAYEILEDTPQTLELQLDLSTFIEEGTLGALGLRIVDCEEDTTVDYTINYAKVTGEGESLATADIIELKYELTGEKKEIAPEDTEVGKHGKLSVAPVEGYTAPTIVDENGAPYQLRGASSHGLSWFPGYVNKDAYQTLRDEWGVNMVRIAVYAREGNYAYVNGETAEAYNDAIIQQGVQAATELGMYVIIDWHVLRYNPNEDLQHATNFFTKYATMYRDYDNVIFEICNEPTGTEWYDGSDNDIYTYGTKVTKTIRDCGSDAIVICGTNNFSSEVDKVAVKPLEDTNVMYACHFYTASHYDEPQKKMTDALAAGVPVFVSEFGICTASGDGMYDVENADKWLDICDDNNVSYACWAMSNSEESAAYFDTDCWVTTGGWTEDQLTTTSKYLINRYRDRQMLMDKQEICKHTNTELKNVKVADCKEKGYTGDRYCRDCDKRLSVGKIMEKVASHSWDLGKVTKQPTTTEQGERTYTCKICGETKKAPISVLTEQHVHTWDEGVVTTEPTATEQGEKTYTCITCGETKTEELAALGVPVKGKAIKDKDNKAIYKITKAGTTGGTVEYSKPVNKNTKTVTIPSTILVDGIEYKVTSVAKNAFKSNSKVTKVTLGNNVKTIGANAFYNCKNLKTVKLGKNVTTIGDKAFYKCSKITSITIPSKVNKIGKQAFYNCKKLKKITIQTSKLTKKKVGSKAFKGIYSKASIKVPKKKLKAYKSLLKDKGVSSKAKIKK